MTFCGPAIRQVVFRTLCFRNKLIAGAAITFPITFLLLTYFNVDSMGGFDGRIRWTDSMDAFDGRIRWTDSIEGFDRRI